MNKPLPYSPYIQAGDFVFTAGQIGRDPVTLEAKPGIEAQTRQTMENLKSHLSASGCSMDDVVKITAYLTSMDDYPAFNDVYETYFNEVFPARTCIAVSELPRVADVDLVVEIEAVAHKK